MFGIDSLPGPLAITFLLGILAIALLYGLTTRNHDFWKKQGVPYVKPLPLVGNLLDMYSKSVHELDMERFKRYGTVYGYFEGNMPVLTVTDPKLIRDILVKDFPSFPSRRSVSTGEKVFDSMLSVVTGEDWKRIRTIVSPTFTTGKIKRLLGIFKDCSDTLVQNFQKVVQEGTFLDAKRFYAAFTMDVIASSSFSTKLDSHNDPDNQFVKTVNSFFRQNNFFFIIFLLFPRLLIGLGKRFLGDFIGFFKGVTLQIIEERKKTGQVRNDFLQLLLDTMKEDKPETNETNSTKENESDIASNYGEQEVAQQIYKNVTSKNLSLDELVAQCILFFVAGSETTASTLSFATYLLAIHSDVKEKLKKEVDQAIQDTDGELTYEAIQSMKYLDNVIAETLRLYPPFLRLDRLADRDYTLGNTGITIPKGVLITIPAYAMHRDPSLYPNPEKFDPDRFTTHQKAERDPYSYVPFGAGPRNCVAMRFALMEMKTCLANVIAHFDINPCPETKIPLEFQFSTAFLMPSGIILDMQIRKDCPLKA